jgi:hypothetical protein
MQEAAPVRYPKPERRLIPCFGSNTSWFLAKRRICPIVNPVEFGFEWRETLVATGFVTFLTINSRQLFVNLPGGVHKLFGKAAFFIITRTDHAYFHPDIES